MTDCAHVKSRLSAYLDGELEGAGRLAVSRHLDVCRACGDVLQDLRDVGELLRSRAPRTFRLVDFSGLAPGVISRTRAEDSQSWRTMLREATGDWHWALTAAGSLCAAVVSIVVVAAVCAVSPHRERDDSLAALLNSLQTPAGTFYVLATPIGSDQAPVLMRYDGDGVVGVGDEAAALPAGFTGPTAGELAFALSEAVVRPDGRVGDLRSMSRRNRQHTEAILVEMQRQRLAALMPWYIQRVHIQRFALVTNARVMGKAL